MRLSHHKNEHALKMFYSVGYEHELNLPLEAEVDWRSACDPQEEPRGRSWPATAAPVSVRRSSERDSGYEVIIERA